MKRSIYGKRGYVARFPPHHAILSLANRFDLNRMKTFGKEIRGIVHLRRLRIDYYYVYYIYIVSW
jgi:hypothetical protein